MAKNIFRLERFDYGKEMIYIMIFLAVYHLMVGIDMTIKGVFIPGLIGFVAFLNYLSGSDHLLFNNLRRLIRTFKAPKSL